MSDSWSPVRLPVLGAEEAWIVQWLVHVGAHVATGDRLAELLAAGVLFHLSAECSGILARIDCERGCLVHEGETLAWINTAADAP